jgi:ribosomal protein L37AE/L43A
MVAAISDCLPHQNPCAQCGHPIAAPVWFEDEPRRTWYLWQCAHCGYQFEAVAFFAESNSEPSAIAA